MKLHLPVKLRASLIAAVIAVSASVYNAYGANTYTEFGKNDHVFTSGTPGLSGNTYIAQEATKTYYYTDDTKAVAIAQSIDNKWYELEADGTLSTTEFVPGDSSWTPFTETVTDDGYLTFEVSSPTPGTTTYETQFEGNTSLTADVVQFNNSVVTKGDAVAGPTSITANDALEVNSRLVAGYSAVALENVSIETASTRLSSDSELSIDNTEAADSVLDLGAVSGKGSLYITGSNVAAMAGANLENAGNLGLANTVADIDGHVAVNDLKFNASSADIDGNVTIGGTLHIDADSAIIASGDILSRTTTGTGNVEALAGSVTSTGGDIFLDNGTITGSVNTTADQSASPDKGDITLNNIDVTDGASIVATGDLTLTGNSTITDIPNDSGTPDDTSDDNAGITVNVGGDLTVDESAIVGVDVTAEGNVLVQNGASIEGGSIDGANNVTVDASTVNGADLENVSGSLTVQNGGTIESGSIIGAEADGIDGITVSGAGSTITGSTITGNEGSITVEDGGALTDSVVIGGAHMEISGSDANVNGTRVLDLEGDIKLSSVTIDGIALSTRGISNQDVSDFDSTIGGSIIISDSTLANATIKSGVSATIGEDGSISYSDVAPAAVTKESSLAGTPVTADVPYGDVKVTDSTLSNVVISTRSGSIDLNSTCAIVEHAAASEPSYIGDLPPNGGEYSSIKLKKGLTAIGVAPEAGKLTSVTVQIRSGHSIADSTVMTLKKGGQVVASSTSCTVENGNATFIFDDVSISPSSRDYELTFSSAVQLAAYKTADFAWLADNWSSRVNMDVLVSERVFEKSISESEITTAAGDIIIDGYLISAATVTTGAGALSVTDSTIAAAALAGTDAEGNAIETYTKTVLSATDASSITGSTVSGADVNIRNGALTITGSRLLDDVNLYSKGDMTITDDSSVNLDGDIQSAGNHDASLVTEGTLDISGAAATLSVANANVQVATKTAMGKDQTLNLTNVYALAGDGTVSAAQLADVNSKAGGAYENSSTLNIDGSTIAIKNIWANNGQSGAAGNNRNPENQYNYFGTVNVKKGAEISIDGTAFVKTMKVNAGDLYTEGADLSSVVINGDAYIDTLQVRGAGEGAGKSYIIDDYKGTEVTIKGNARIDELKFDNEGVLSLVGNGSTSSAVASIGPAVNYVAHGIINVVNGELTTPKLNNGDYLSLGLNGGTVILGDVAAVGDALGASADAVDANVKLRDLTDAHQTGVAQLDSRSTIQTGGLTRLATVASTEAGTTTAVEGAKAYMYKVNCGQGNTVTVAEGMKLYKENAEGSLELLPAGSVLNDGDVVAKYNFEYTTTTLGTGAVENTGAIVSEALAGLTDAEDDFLSAITAPIVGETKPGSIVNLDGKDYTVLPTGQLTLAVDATYQASASATLGAVETKDDGIASLTVLRDFSANKTDINAYELSTVARYWKDGAEITPEAYNALADDEKAGWNAEYAAVANTGFITISGKLTGSDNQLTADNNIALGGIGVDGTDANGNILLSTRGAVNSGAITGDANELEAAASINVDGKLTGDANELTSHGMSASQYGIRIAGGIAGDQNTLTADTGRIILDATDGVSLAGTGNTLLAKGTNSVGEGIYLQGALQGNGNTLTSETGGIQAGTITSADDATAAGQEGKGNTLTAMGNIATGAITGDCNTLASEEGFITTGAIDGEYNELVAAATVTTGAIEGNGNILTANGIEVEGDGATLTTGTITGDANKLTAVNGDILTESIAGDGNTLTGTTIETGAVNGDGNELTATESIETGDITGNSNKLLSETAGIVSGSITGNSNELTATNGEITTGAIMGAENALTAKGDVTVTSIAGAGQNTVTTAEGDIIITGGVDGSDNTLTATTGDVYIVGVLQGSGTEVDGGIISVGTLAGTGQELIARGTVSPDDVAITIDAMTAQGTTVKVGTTGGATGNGAIVIGEMGAVEGTPDATLVNTIESASSSVTIASLTGANAYTSITAEKGIIVGNADATEADTASNQNWTAANLQINSGTGLVLTNSTLAITGNVSGTNLTLDATADGSSKLTANKVDLDSLTIAGASTVDASEVTVNDLTIDGTKATLKSTDVTVTDELTLKNGGKLDGVNVDTATLVLENSDLKIAELTGVTGLVLKGSEAVVGTGLTNLTNEVRAEALNGEASSLTTNTISTTSQVVADASTITTTQGGISADNGVVATNGGTISSAQGITSSAASVTAEDGATITANGSIYAANGAVKADGGTISNGANEIVAGSMEISNGGTITTGAVVLTGSLDAADGTLTAASVTGATGAVLNAASITGELAMSGPDADVVATGGNIGSITGANDVSTTNTTVGAIGMTGKLTATNGTIDSVSGASGAELTNANITGSLNSDGEIVTGGGSIGCITGGATKVELNGTSIGSITMSTEGDLIVKDTKTDAVNADNGNTVANATLTNATIGSGMNVTGDMITIGNVTVKGDVNVGNDLSVNTGTLAAANVTVHGTTTLTNGTVAVEGSFHSTTVKLNNIDGKMAELKADKGLILSGSDLDVTITGTDVDAISVAEGGMSLSDGAEVTNKGGANISGGLTVDAATFKNVGTIELNNDGLSASDGAAVTAAGITEAGAVSVTAGATVTAGSVTGATTVSVTTDGTLTGDVAASDSVSVTDGGKISGDITGASTVDVTRGGKLIGSVTNASGAVTVHNGTITGSVTTADAATLTDAEVKGSVTATGAAALSNSTISGALEAGDTTVSTDSKVGSAAVKNLAVATGATLTAEGSVVTAGDLDIAGKVVSNTGDITLAGDGTVSADVTAAAGELSIDGNLDASEVTLTGKTLDIAGTLNAGKGVKLVGTVTGVGSIVKTGGDTLVLAGDTAIGGVKVDGSKLDAAAGATLGTLTLKDSTMQIAGEKNMGSVAVNGGSIDAGSIVVADVKLGQRSGSDQIRNSGVLSIDGAVLQLNDMGTNEANVADQERHSVVTGSVMGSFAAEVLHSYDTLNVHAEGGDIVFSRNYKGAAGKTENQSATADALAALDAPVGELGAVMDALEHTRSEEAALAALESLSGAGLAAAPKLIADETKEHLQTLRSTLQSVAAGLQRRYAPSGIRLSDVESTSVSASVTGGSSTVNEDGNAAEYNRDSIGAMFTVAHAINDEWTFGAALSFSQADADCGATKIDSDGVFLDVGLLHRRGRFAQMGSIGAAFFSMDTERMVGVNAPGHGYSGTAEGSTDAMAFTMSYETTYAIWQTESYSLSSLVMAEALFAQVDNMEEDGMGNAGLRSSFDDVASFTFGVGARYTYRFGDQTVNPGYFSAEAMFVADTGDSTTKVNNAFIGGGNSFQLSGPEAGNCGLRLNAGLLVPLGDQWGIFGNVTGEFRSEQTTAGGSAGLKYTF